MRYIRRAGLLAALALLACSREPSSGAEGAKTRTSLGESPKGQEVNQGTSGGTPPQSHPLSGDLRSMPSPAPAGNIQIRFECFHSMMPFGKGSRSWSVLIDLAKGTMDSSSTENDGSDPDPADPDKGTKRSQSQTRLDGDRASMLRTKLDAVLRGGPYKCEYPPPEGVSCELALQLEGQNPFFSVIKSSTFETDAASDLVKTIGMPAR